jgi:hypothetical protein
MRINPREPKAVWRTIAVTNKDPLVFAKELESALQELTDAGFNIVSQMTRDSALVITGQKVEMPAEPQAYGTAPTQPPPGLRRRIVDTGRREHGATTDEVLYHYMEGGEQKQEKFADLVDALRVLKMHLTGTADVVPISLMTVTMTRFEPEALPLLLKTFADDLNTDTPPG